MDKLKWLKMKRILRIIIGVTIAAFICIVLWIFTDYQARPDVYASYSAPWYSKIIIAAVISGIAVLVELLGYIFVRHKSSSGPIIGVIERKE